MSIEHPHDGHEPSRHGEQHGESRFDAKAATWDQDPDKVARAGEIAAGIAARVALDPTMRLLDYGAGTGLVTQALRDRVGPATLADSSAGMRDVIEAKITAGALGGARVWDLDLELDPVPDEAFDLIVTSMVLHHVTNLPRVLTGFAELLEPGGALCIADLDAEDGGFHDHDFDGHHGFDRDALAAALGAAGFGAVSIQDCTEITRDGRPYSVFLAIGTR